MSANKPQPQETTTHGNEEEKKVAQTPIQAEQPQSGGAKQETPK